MPDERYQERRKRTLTDEDIELLRNEFTCHNKCSFTQEEVLFVRDWLETMKTAKSEVVKFIVKGIIYAIGITCAAVVAAKMGWFRFMGK